TDPTSLGVPPGLGWALVFTPSLGAVSRWFPSHRPLATGLAVSGAAASGLALGPLVPLALERYGWRGALLLLAAVSLNLVAAAALLRPPPSIPTVTTTTKPTHEEPPALLALLRHGPFLRFAASFALLDAGYYVPFVHGAARAHELGGGPRAAGAVLAAMAVADGAGRLLAGWLAARPASAPLLWHLRGWAALAGVLALMLPLAGGPGGLAALAAAYGGCAGAVAPLQFAGAAEVAGQGREELGIGLMQVVESAGSLLGAPLAGWLRDLTGDFTVSFLTAGAFLLAGTLLLLTLLQGVHNPTPTPDSPENPPEPPKAALEPSV
ncbi:monocarboxylate transporter 13-like, partial [Myiozetetes cayanensis]|uniref:monocarboxylate transporter 13-like n=1 Tax=Myiozetetes cayanensis TaxID=478635 RepID=UPI00215E6A4A